MGIFLNYKTSKLSHMKKIAGTHILKTFSPTGFIKEGKNQAIIHITMTNAGFKAYKPELYGNELTVIRTLSKTSSFKIKADNGKECFYL